MVRTEELKGSTYCAEKADFVDDEEEPRNSVTSREFHDISLKVIENKWSKVSEVDQNQDRS